MVDYFHRLDDPYSHPAAQALTTFAARYDVMLGLHLIRASGGASQPELEKPGVWGRRDAELIAPHLSLSFPKQAGTISEPDHRVLVGRALAAGGDDADITSIAAVSGALWSGDEGPLVDLAEKGASDAELNAELDAGSDLMGRRKHYSGAMFIYGGEWSWGVDRLSHLENRLRELGACKEPPIASAEVASAGCLRRGGRGPLAIPRRETANELDAGFMSAPGARLSPFAAEGARRKRTRWADGGPGARIGRMGGETSRSR